MSSCEHALLGDYSLATRPRLGTVAEAAAAVVSWVRHSGNPSLTFRGMALGC